MSPLFYEDSLGEKLAEKFTDATDRVREAELEFIDDPEALESAERAVHDLDTTPDYSSVTDDWVTVFGPSKVSGILDVAGPNAMLIAMPLDAEGIAYCWEPYPPAEMPGVATPAEHAVDRPFSLRVAPEDEQRARQLLADARPGSPLVAGVPATHERTPEARATRRVLSGKCPVHPLRPRHHHAAAGRRPVAVRSRSIIPIRIRLPETESHVPAGIITWTQDISNLGAATVAIGVFDGVHLGHQALLRDAVADARARDVRAVAVTFDRDPDQVVSPGNAAPQLLTLADKLACIAETSVDVILVVPFTPLLAEMAPESFVDSVLLSAMRPVSVHVGRDFRFGAGATGDISTLQRLGMSRGFELVPHDLVSADGEPITSTRIRKLVAEGDVAAAGALLCYLPRVTGTVHRGRGEGVKLGFPTANIVPVAYAALPASGVYAGRAKLEDGVEWAAAISVGTPPTFPEARDYLEAHLVDFEGDLYGQTVTLEFFEKLRDQQAYGSLEELTEAIANDVERTLEIAGFEDDSADEDEFSDEDAVYTDEDLVEDPAALAAAEALVAGHDPSDVFDSVDSEWVEVLDSAAVSNIFDAPGWSAFMITSPLDAAGIPYVWDPYEPGSMPVHHPVPIQIIQPFRLLVPVANLAEAQSILSEADGAVAEGSVEPAVDGDPDDDPATSPVSDPAALAAAEAAVRELPEDSKPDSDDELVTLASDLPLDTLRLQAIDARLSAAGVSAVWDPYPPQEAPLLRVGLFGENRFRIKVWNSQLEIAREAFQDFESGE